MLNDQIIAGVVSGVVVAAIVGVWPAFRIWLQKRPWAYGALAGGIASLIVVGLTRVPPPPPENLPAGIVIASQEQCARLGDGWVEFEKGGGRFIVGVGSTKDENGATQKFKVDDDLGGEFRVKLKSNEVPLPEDQSEQRVVLIPLNESGETIRHGGGPEGFKMGFGKRLVDAHNNLPPYVPLYFCELEG